MTRTTEEASSASDSSLRLDDRVRELLSEFPGSVAFQGLRRTLGVHPESLTRALRRLEREGAVERTQEGYRLTEARNLDARGTFSRPGAPRWEGAPRVELRLSPGEQASRLIGALSGRWFGEFRWVGSYEEGRRTTLLWVSRQGRELLGLVLEGDLLRIHQQGPSAAIHERPFACYELLQHVLTALRGTERGASHLAPPAVLPLSFSTPATPGPRDLAG
ncbi:MAG: hypothetical protein KGJ23_02585 [Euryarchaeota archaeon]|nr:hypothetical protein [Euryarchaeota archaeon]MDE1835484.1 hypothetical protein [Euryarchaeota archaeon]MDE1880377.1 hypothetical protein [Euryarchaeota archaeon]MDE2045765.1 hypothetical protein [Thermoplasmata archaeon]